MASIFRGLPTKQVTLLHQDGHVTPRQKALINDKGSYIMIILEGEPGMIQAGDRIEYKDKDGMVDVYVIIDPGYHAKQFGVKPYYSAKVEKDGSYFQSATGQTFNAAATQPVTSTSRSSASGISSSMAAAPAAGRSETAATAQAASQSRPQAASSQGPSTQLLFETLRTFVASQEDKQTLLFLIGEMESSVGTSNYAAMYDSFIQTIAGRIPLFAYFIPQLSHLLLE